MHPPTNKWKACPPFVLLLEGYDRYNDPKNTKATILIINLLEKERGSSLSVCLHMRFKYDDKFQIETRKIERGIATMPLVPITI